MLTIRRQGVTRIVSEADFEKKYRAQGYEIVPEPKAKPEPKPEAKK